MHDVWPVPMGDSDTKLAIRDNAARSRYEAEVDGGVAFIDYAHGDDGLILSHTEVPEALRGQGIAHRLIRSVLEQLRGEHRTMVPLCPFVLSFVKRHPEYRDVVVAKYRNLLPEP